MMNCWKQVAIIQFSGTSKPSNKKEWHRKLKKRSRRKMNTIKYLKKEKREVHLSNKDEFVQAFYDTP